MTIKTFFSYKYEKTKRFSLSFCITLAMILQASSSISAPNWERHILQMNIEKLFTERQCVGCNLQGAMLNRLKLQNVNLAGANLDNAHLYLSNLRGANFQGASLKGTQFGGADISEANFIGADIRGASFTGAYQAGTIIFNKNSQIKLSEKKIQPKKKKRKKRVGKGINSRPTTGNKNEEQGDILIRESSNPPQSKKIRFFKPVKIK